MSATASPTQAHSHAGGQAGAKPKLYNLRHPERTLLYQSKAEHFKTWFELASCVKFDGQGDHHTPKPCVRQAFRKLLDAASLPTALPGCGVTDVGTTTSSPIPAKVGASAQRATPGAWHRRRGASAIRSCPACRCASGCCLCPSGCAASCSEMGPRPTWCCASSCACAKPAGSQPRCSPGGQGGAAHWRNRFHHPLRLQPERAYALSRARAQWSV